MARRSTRNRPASATVLRTYAELREVLAAFAQGFFALLVILGRPGLGKSQHIRRAIEGTGAGYFKGYYTRLALYGRVFQFQDRPLVFDDTNLLFENKDTKIMIRDLTETDQFKRIEYGSTSAMLARDNLPTFFYTRSPVCFVTNYWAGSDPVFQALESRGEFFAIEIDWGELHQDVATWFWDQEIFDYVQDRLLVLREPDARLYVKSWERKKSDLTLTPWKALIDNYSDDRHGRIIRTLLSQDFVSDNQRYQSYLEIVQQLRVDEEIRPLARSNFYARAKSIRSYMPTNPLPRIILQNTSPPIETRPADGLLPRVPRLDAVDDDDDDDGASQQPSTATNGEEGPQPPSIASEGNPSDPERRRVRIV